MNISGIRPSAEFYAYNTTKEQEVENRQMSKENKPDITCEKNVEESEYVNLDVERAIDTMKKDQVIHQYQFFAGGELSL